MEAEDGQTIRDKHLPCLLLATGILVFCLTLSVAAHLDAQPCGQEAINGRFRTQQTGAEERLVA